MAESILVTVTNDLNQDQRMHRICNSLQEEGYDVTLLGREKLRSGSLLKQKFKQKRLSCYFNKGALFYLEYNIRALIFALKLKANIFYAVDLDSLLAAGIASRMLGAKLVHDAHEYFIEVPELEGSTFKKGIWHRLGRYFIPKCNLCFSVNTELANILSDRYENHFHVVRSVPYLDSKNDETRKHPHQSSFRLLYQGVLNKGRGLEECIQAISNLEADVKLRIAGEGDISEELKNMVERLGIQDKVDFLGWLSPEQLRQETLTADLGMNLLSAKSLNYKYSLANKFFDYMHAEVPSINMNFPVYSRICAAYEVGICIDTLDAGSIQSAIRAFISNPARIEAIKANCKRAKLEFNWQVESRILIELFRKYL